MKMAHAGGKAHGRENDLQTIQRALRHKPDIVEIDVRKSKDGVLYCHHGSVPVGVSAAQFFRFFTFEKIQKLVGKRDTLEDIVRAVPESTVLLLDVKDMRVSGADLRKALHGRRQVWVAVTTPGHMRRLQRELGDEVAFLLFGASFFIRHILPRTFGLNKYMHLMINGKRESILEYNDLSQAQE